VKLFGLFIAPVLILTAASLAKDNQFEISLTDEELKKLDTFEGHTLAKADQTFAKKQYRQARAQYDAFILEFPKSKVTAYALLRKGRCVHLDEKRFKAVSDYDEVLDYFPNEVRYAAAAIYFIGECHWQNGDIAKAMKAWARMADDKGYSKEPLAAFALNRLADNLLKREKPGEAVKYYSTVAINFRTANVPASEHARAPVIEYHVKTTPDEKQIRDFYTKMRGFERHQQNVPKDLDTNVEYWRKLRELIRYYGTKFTDVQGDLKKTFFTYWAGQMGGKFPEDDDFAIERAYFRYLGNGDMGKWFVELDTLYSKGKQGDWQRLLKWMRAVNKHPKKVEQYFGKLNAGKLDNKALVAMMKALWTLEATRPTAKKLIPKFKFDQMQDVEKGALAFDFWEEDESVTSHFLSKIDYKKLGFKNGGSLAVRFREKDKGISKHILGKISFAEVDDKDIANLANGLWHHQNRAEELGEQVCNRIKNVEFRKWTFVKHYHNHYTCDPKKGLPIATDLTKSAKYAEEAWWYRGNFQEWLKQYKDAIKSYMNCDNMPTNLWHIAECYVKLKEIKKGINQLKEVETSPAFKEYHSRAAWRIGEIYNYAGMKKQYISALRHVMKKYKNSTQSRQAHQELERLGVKIGGGIDAD